jgi:hypothetical protein
MNTKLLQLEQRVKELDLMAQEVDKLAHSLANDGIAQPELLNKGHAWHRGARELLVQQRSTALKEFDECYIHMEYNAFLGRQERDRIDIERYFSLDLSVNDQPCEESDYPFFYKLFAKACSLVRATLEEVKSRELPVVTQLSFAVSCGEFDTALDLLTQSSGNDAVVRAAGVVARVALERHLLTVADIRSVAVAASSPNKKITAQDALNALVKQGVITPIQKSELEGLFKIGNFCAHPKESVTQIDVSRLVDRGRELCSVIS